jgi:hypothetical protein
MDDEVCYVLSRSTGQTINTLLGVRDVWESAQAPLTLLESRLLVLQATGGRTVAIVRPTTFAVLSVAFGPGLLVISESNGPVRCFETQKAKELWRYVPPVGHHVLQLAYAKTLESFAGISWPYEHGGTKRLLRFNSQSGVAETIADLGYVTETAFCKSGSYLVSSDGFIIEVASGHRMYRMAFSE